MPLLPREIGAALLLAAACAGTPAQAAEPPGAFALVDDAVITAEQYEAALHNTLRQRYFHRQVPDEKRRELEREVAQSLIERALLLAECRRRGMAVERSRIEAQLDEYRARELEERELLEQLRSAVHAVGSPTEQQLLAYYREHEALFVEPEQLRLSALVLKVDPASPAAAWERAEREAEAMRRGMLERADFSALADKGTFHQGTLAQAISARLAAMAQGELSEPMRVLEGVALVRLTERKPARAQPFEEARTRAAQLWQREEGAQRWKVLVASLRGAATVRIDLTRYPALAGIAP